MFFNGSFNAILNKCKTLKKGVKISFAGFDNIYRPKISIRSLVFISFVELLIIKEKYS